MSKKDSWENAGRLRDLCEKIEALRVRLHLSSWDAMGRVVAQERAIVEARVRGEELNDAELEDVGERQRTMLHPIKRGAQPNPSTLRVLAQLSGEDVDVWYAVARWAVGDAVDEPRTAPAVRGGALFERFATQYDAGDDLVNTALDISKRVFMQSNTPRPAQKDDEIVPPSHHG